MSRLTTWLAGGASLSAVVTALALVHACYSPGLARCSVRCGAGGTCPNNLECSSDDYCLPAGETCAGNPDADAGGAADAGGGADAGIVGSFRSLAAGQGHSCAIDTHGGLRCWGANDQGQLGVPGAMNSGFATRVGVELDWQEVVAGYAHTCGLRGGGRLFCWGTNGDGQVGDGTNGSFHAAPSEVSTPASGTSWTRVAVGAIFTCAIRDNGTLWCWGSNIAGQLARPAAIDASAVPVQIGTGSDWTAIGAGLYHVCGIRESAGGDGDLYCWGYNGGDTDGDGRLGVGLVTASLRVPTVTAEGGADIDWESLELGDSYGCGLDPAGAMYCWGSGSQVPGGAGQANVPTRYATGTGYLQVSAGGNGGCVRIAGQVQCWGSNGLGELGRPPGDGSSTPVSVASLAGVQAIAVGYAHVCALLAGGEIRCWGDNANGQVGDGTVAGKLSPVEVGASIAPWRSVDIGLYHTCGVAETSGAAYCWGRNNAGQIGSAAAGPLAYTPTPVTFAGSWRQVTAGGSHSCGLDSSGAIHCWGSNDTGELGSGGGPSTVPVPVEAGEHATLDTGLQHNCVLDPAGARVCWGVNDRTELGNGTSGAPVATPTVIAGGPAAWSALALGVYFGCGVGAGADAGKLWCWGENESGQLARVGGATATAPLEVTSTMAGWTAVGAGLAHACGIRGGVQGNLLCWGNNSGQQVGVASTNPQPIPIALANADWTHVDLGGTHTCAVRANGDLHCWGDNYLGQLGDGTLNGRAGLGASLAGAHDWLAVSAGADRSCGIRGVERRLYCWGENAHGAIGDGTGARFVPVAVVLAP